MIWRRPHNQWQVIRRRILWVGKSGFVQVLHQIPAQRSLSGRLVSKIASTQYSSASGSDSHQRQGVSEGLGIHFKVAGAQKRGWGVFPPAGFRDSFRLGCGFRLRCGDGFRCWRGGNRSLGDGGRGLRSRRRNHWRLMVRALDDDESEPDGGHGETDHFPADNPIDSIEHQRIPKVQNGNSELKCCSELRRGAITPLEGALHGRVVGVHLLISVSYLEQVRIKILITPSQCWALNFSKMAR